MIRSKVQGLVKAAAEAADLVRRPSPGVIVLLYHRVGGGSGLAVDLPPSLFEAQIAHLAATGRVVPLDTALDALAADDPPPVAPVVLTVDDGTADFVDVVMPVLERHRLPVTLFVATDHVERGRPFPGGGAPASWSGLSDALSTGLVTVGSHTHTHALLDRAAPGVVEDELDRSRELIAARLGRVAEHFAYPKAVLGSPQAEAAVRARFRSAAVAGTRANPYGRTDPHRLARSPIQVQDGMRWFERKLAGGMALEDQVRRLANRRRYAGATT